MKAADLLDPEKMQQIDKYFGAVQKRKKLTKAMHEEQKLKFRDNLTAFAEDERARKKIGMETMQNDEA